VRYAAELASACGTRHLKPGIKRAKEFQDALGDHQDAVVATRRLTELEVELWRPAARLAITALLDCQDADRANARAAAPSAWRRLHRSLPA
jgi:CHAD domain-containing protein